MIMVLVLVTTTVLNHNTSTALTCEVLMGLMSKNDKGRDVTEDDRPGLEECVDG